MNSGEKHYEETIRRLRALHPILPDEQKFTDNIVAAAMACSRSRKGGRVAGVIFRTSSIAAAILTALFIAEQIGSHSSPEGMPETYLPAQQEQEQFYTSSPRPAPAEILKRARERMNEKEKIRSKFSVKLNYYK